MDISLANRERETVMAHIIISYCRADQHLVRPFTKLLGGALSVDDEAVYWDDRFRSDESWTQQFKDGLTQSDKLFVFWCDHSAGSDAVRKEVELANSMGKPVIPVLFDNTPLSDFLAPIHGIDLRPIRVHRLDPIRTLIPRFIRIARQFVEASTRRPDGISSYSLVVALTVGWVLVVRALYPQLMSTAMGTIVTCSQYLVVFGPVVLLMAYAVMTLAGREWRLRALAKDYTRPGSVGDFVVREFNRRLRHTESQPV